MNEKQLLVGSLSNDLFRVASLSQRGSMQAASRFLTEAKRWAEQLQKEKVADYINNIAKEISETETTNIDEATAEKYLMFGVLLQNYSLHSNWK